MLFSKVRWTQASDVLIPEACFIEKLNFEHLFKLLVSFTDIRLSGLKGVWCESFVVLIGGESNLPWLPGVQYFGIHEKAPNVYMPTQLKCSLKYDVVQNIIMKDFNQGAYLLEPNKKLVVPLIAARTLDRAFIQTLISS